MKMTYEAWLREQLAIATRSGDELTPQEIALDWKYHLQREQRDPLGFLRNENKKGE